jgi:SAM-dependent methyltransferase
MNATYDSQFFSHQSGAMRSASKVLPMIFDLVPARTIADVGCGIGAWTRVARDLGCQVTGFDGDWVPRDQLLIDRNEFVGMDLTNPPASGTATFDLVLSLETGEHLPASVAERFVRFLTSLGPAVAFSAAVPCQLGTHHVNEQYAGYWARLFQDCGFVPFDVIRPRCWYDRDIEFYYRQNLVMYVAGTHAAAFEQRARSSAISYPLDVVHPDAVPILAQGWVEAGGTQRCISLLRKTVTRSIRKRLGLDV